VYCSWPGPYEPEREPKTSNPGRGCKSPALPIADLKSRKRVATVLSPSTKTLEDFLRRDEDEKKQQRKKDF
jgi:hypothetical protein